MATKEAFKRIIREWQERELPPVTPRDLVVPLDSRKIIALYGPRRSGKSFFFFALMQQLRSQGVAPERMVYISFEDDRLLPLFAKDLDGLLEAYDELYPPAAQDENVYFFLDEIQNIKGWEVFVRRLHDTRRIRLFITGSSSRLLSREIATALRGRTLPYPFYPLTFAEFIRFRGIPLPEDPATSPQRHRIKKAMDEFLEYGGFPEVVLEPNKILKDKILEEYVESLVHRDLLERYNLSNGSLLRELLEMLAANVTGTMTVNSWYKRLRHSMPVSRNTVAEYIAHIEDTSFFSLLPKFSWSHKERAANARKIICLDTGLRNRMSLRFSPDTGKLAENVVGELLRRKGEVFWWKNGHEVDFVTVSDRKPRPVNVTYGESIENREYESLQSFQKAFPEALEPLLLTKDHLWLWALSAGSDTT